VPFLIKQLYVSHQRSFFVFTLMVMFVKLALVFVSHGLVVKRQRIFIRPVPKIKLTLPEDDIVQLITGNIVMIVLFVVLLLSCHVLFKLGHEALALFDKFWLLALYLIMLDCIDLNYTYFWRFLELHGKLSIYFANVDKIVAFVLWVESLPKDIFLEFAHVPGDILSRRII